MQAQQSNNASGRPASPSPVIAPIQAARKYFERQRAGEPAGTNVGASDALLEDFDSGVDVFAHHTFGSHEMFRSSEDGNGDELYLPERDSVDDVPPPTADAVRAAIFRLARESKWTQRIASQGFAPEREPGTEAGSSETVTARHSCLSREFIQDPLQGYSQDGDPAADMVGYDVPAALAAAEVPAMDFAEVALRVWDESPDGHSAVEDRGIGRAAASSIASTHVVGESAAREDSAANNSIVALEASGEEDDVPAGMLDAADGPALAHDAGNLLSAMGLYSELLSLSGVLQANHRHYAEDLRLLVDRSRVLIERLLRFSRIAASSESVSGAAEDKLLAMVAPSAGNKETKETSSPFAAPPVMTHMAVAARSEPDMRSVGRPGVRLRAGGGAESREAAPPASLKAMQGNVRALPPLVFEYPGIRADGVSLAQVLTRWSSLLAIISHSAVTVYLGPLAELPVAVPVEVLERIVVNLVRNATEAIREGGAIRIGAGVFRREEADDEQSEAKPERTMVLRVDDSGCGMSELRLRQVLNDPSHGETCELPNQRRDGHRDGGQKDEGLQDRLDGKSNRPKGRGLGLGIVRELVAASGGAMFIQSRPGRGTRVEIQWPVVRTAAAITRPARVAVLSPDVSSTAGRSGSNPAILSHLAMFTPLSRERGDSARRDAEYRITGYRGARHERRSDEGHEEGFGDEGAIAC